jgi:hypothetical protein
MYYCESISLLVFFTLLSSSTTYPPPPFPPTIVDDRREVDAKDFQPKVITKTAPTPSEPTPFSIYNPAATQCCSYNSCWGLSRTWGWTVGGKGMEVNVKPDT